MDFHKKITQPFHEFLRLCFSMSSYPPTRIFADCDLSGSEEAATWALPSTPDVVVDAREAERLPVASPVVVEPPKAKKSKKSKKSKAKSAAIVEEPGEDVVKGYVTALLPCSAFGSDYPQHRQLH